MANDFHAGPVPVTSLEEIELGQLQQFLQDSGYPPGAVDGLWGPKTKAAWELFASNNGLEAGSIDGGTWDSIAGSGQIEFVQGPGGDTTIFEQGGGVPGTSGAGDGIIDEEELNAIRAKYPTLAHLLDDPEIFSLLTRATEEGLAASEFTLALEATEWWKTTTASQRTFDASINRDPASVQKRIDEQKQILQATFESYGIRLDDAELSDMAFDVVRNGTNETGVLRIVGDRARQTMSGEQSDSFGGDASGQMAAITQQLSSMARAFHMGYSPDTLEEWAVRIVEGRWSYDAAEATIRKQAADAYPSLRSQLEQGMTVEDYYAPTKNRLAQVLEMNPNAIDFTDEKWSEFTQMVDDQGQVRPLTYAEIGQKARGMDEYFATDSASEASYGMMNGLLNTFGVV